MMTNEMSIDAPGRRVFDRTIELFYDQVFTEGYHAGYEDGMTELATVVKGLSEHIKLSACCDGCAATLKVIGESIVLADKAVQENEELTKRNAR